VPRGDLRTTGNGAILFRVYRGVYPSQWYGCMKLGMSDEGLDAFEMRRVGLYIIKTNPYWQIFCQS
jgi:hypothetical protein